MQELNDHLRNEDIDSERVLSKLRSQELGAKIKEVDEMSDGAFDDDG